MPYFGADLSRTTYYHLFMRKRQRTINSPATVSGVGLHTGIPSSATFFPAPENSGIVFFRSDLEGAPEIPANVDLVSDTLRGTTLTTEAGHSVRTVEHVLSALAGLEIDNCRVELTAEEPPAGDGSAQVFVDALKTAGFCDQSAPRSYLHVDEPMQFSVGGTEYSLLPGDRFSATVFVEYVENGFPMQNFSLTKLGEEYEKEIASARTFCFLSEVEELQKKGLIKGGRIDNAVVIVDNGFDNSHLRKIASDLGVEIAVEPYPADLLVGEAFRFENEPARHKLLDLMGDLSLLGYPVRGSVIAIRPGHAGNIQFARTLKQNALKKGLFKHFDVSDEGNPLMDINEVMNVLPHRYPFLLVDKVINIDQAAGRIIGVKNVTVNEPYFQGHFPGFPIMPGVLIVEAMAQTGGMLLMNEVGGGSGKLAVFMGINNAKFRRPVMPGDTLRLEMTMKGKRFSTYTMEGKATVDGKVVAQAEITVAVIDRQQS